MNQAAARSLHLRVAFWTCSQLALPLSLLGGTAAAYQPLKNPDGGNVTLDKKEYKAYISADARRDAAKSALDKWKAEMAAQGVTLSVQAGNPPQMPLNEGKLSEEIEKYNKDPMPDPAMYPEIEKYKAKMCTIMVYFESSADISKRNGAGGSERGLTRYQLSQASANKIHSADVFLPTDPPGANDTVKNRILHNIAMHEFGHVAGFDHYTPAQVTAGGQVMQEDATLFSTETTINPEDKRGLNQLYGTQGQSSINPNSQQRHRSELEQRVQDKIPGGIDEVWQYDYDMNFLSGSEIPYFQFRVGAAPIFLAEGSGGFADWLVQPPPLGKDYLAFEADGQYLGTEVLGGRFTLYSSVPPTTQNIIYGDEMFAAPVPFLQVPEPATGILLMLAVSFIGRIRRRD